MNTSTPVNITYFDQPEAFASFVDDLADDDMRFFTLGYIYACDHIKESLSDNKTKFLTAMLNFDSEEDEQVVNELLNFVNLLEHFERRLTTRTKYLIDSYPHKLLP